MKSTAAEAMAKYGAKGLSEQGLLTTFGIPETAAQELLQLTGNSIGAIARLSLQDMEAIKGIGKSKAAMIVAALELGRRRQSETAAQREQITSSADAYALLTPHMRDLDHEQFWIILLDRRSKVIRMECIHIGGMSAMVVDPKIVFQKALQYKACSIILSHNHPSGATSPSNEDCRLTDKLKAAGQFIDIKILDHVIVGEGAYYSFADEGKI